MKKLLCDACGKDITGYGLANTFEYLNHIEMMKDETSFPGVGFIDSDENPVSGREERKDVCNKCYNAIMTKAYARFVELRKENDIKD